jgi:uncharacterized membrane protein YgcG
VCSFVKLLAGMSYLCTLKYPISLVVLLLLLLIILIIIIKLLAVQHEVLSYYYYLFGVEALQKGFQVIQVIPPCCSRSTPRSAGSSRHRGRCTGSWSGGGGAEVEA